MDVTDRGLKASARGGGVVLQAGRDIITGTVFTGTFARLRDVWLDPGPVFDEVEIEKFAGREWLLDRIDRFLERHDHGYVVIQAPAGVGKTMVAAWLAANRGWPCHFTRRAKGRNTATALRNLAAQVIAGFQLAEQFAPGGVLPETAGEPGWFEQVLKAGAAAAAESGRRLVLIVDGLDEAESFDAELPLGLPTRLPRGVVMIVTCRSGSRLLGLRMPWEPTTIELADPRNLHDMRRFIAGTVRSDDVIRACLAESGLGEIEFTEQLMRRCGGVWVYLRYVFDELRYGQRSASDIADLPSELSSYYAKALHPDDGNGSPPDPAESARTRLLSTLAAVTEPLPATSLARLAGIGDASVAEDLCGIRLRPFLTEVPDAAGVLRYGIYHVSLRDYLHGTIHKPMLDGDRALAARLARWAEAAHARIADHYLAEIDEALDGYALRNPALHLERCGRADDLHGLLAAERTNEDGTVRNLWYAAHDRAGTIADYLSDVERARRLIARRNDVAIAAGRPAAGIGLEIRYLVLAGGALSLTNSVPANLVVRLVREGLWTGERALSHAGHLVWPQDRITLMSQLLPWLPESKRDGVLDSVISLARLGADPVTRAEAFTALARTLGVAASRSVLSEAVEAALAVDEVSDIAEELAELLRFLPNDLLSMVLLAVLDRGASSERDDLLAALIPLVSPEEVRAILEREWSHSPIDPGIDVLVACADRHDAPLGEELLALARAAEGASYYRAICLAVVAGRQHPPVRERVLEEALATARAEDDLTGRANALHWVMTAMPPGADRSEVLAEYLAVAARDEPEKDPIWAAVTVAESLSEMERRALAQRCRAFCAEAPDDEARAAMIEALAAAEWTTPQHRDLVEAVSGIADESHRARALEALSWTVPEELRAEVIRLVHELTDPDRRLSSLEGLAATVCGPTVGKLLDEVVRLPHSYHRSRLVADMAEGMPTALIGQAQDAVQSTTDEFGRAMLLGRIAAVVAPPLRADLVAEATANAVRVLYDNSRARAFARIAEASPPQDRGDMLADALESVMVQPSGQTRFYAIKELLPQLPDALLSRAIESARAAALDDSFVDPPSYALTCLARWASPARRDELIREAVAAVRAIPSNGMRAVMLADVSICVPDPVERRALFREALTLADHVADDLPAGWRHLAPVALRVFRLLPETLQSKAVSQGRGFVGQDGTDPSASVERILRFVPDAVLGEALDAVVALPYPQARNRILGNLTLHLSERNRRTMLNHLLRDVTDIQGRRALLVQGGHLWNGKLDPDRMDILRRCLSGIELDSTLALLSDGFDLVAGATNPEDLAEACLDALRLAERWWPRLATT
jgi:AAA ATPase-like protein